MEKTDHILSILKDQQALITELEAEVGNLASTDMVTENKELKTKLQGITSSFDTLKQDHDAMSEELNILRSAFKKQIYNERFQRINKSKRQSDVLFEKEVGTQMNRLEAFEIDTKRRIQDISDKIAKISFGTENEMRSKLHELDALVNKRIEEIRRIEAEHSSLFKQLQQEELEALYNTEITEEQAQKHLRMKNIESLIGLNIFNKLGILLLIIGTIAAGRYAYVKLPDTFKTALIFIIGLAMIGLGEGIRKKTSAVFNQGILSGGSAILYVGLVVGYLSYDLFSATFAFILCIMITALAFFLSLRHKSQTISVFALIGGFIPLFAFFMYDSGQQSASFENYTIIAIYLSILSLFTLLISFFKRWDITRISSAVLNIVASVSYIYYIFSAAKIGRIYGEPYPDYFHTHFPSFDYKIRTVVFAYLALTFIIAIAIPLLTAIKNKLSFRRLDILYLAFVGGAYSIIIYISADLFFSPSQYPMSIALSGVLAVFILAAYLIHRYLKGEKKTVGVLLSYSLVLAMLIPYIALEARYLIYVWAAEMAALFIYSILRGKKAPEIAGWLVLSVSMIHFIYHDVMRWQRIDNTAEFLIQFSVFTLFILSVLGLMIYKNVAVKTKLRQVYSGISIIFTWIFSHVFINLIWQIDRSTSFLSYNSKVLIIKSIAMIAALLIPFIALRIKQVYKPLILYVGAALYGISAFMMIFQNSTFYYHPTKNLAVNIALILLPCLANIAAILGVIDGSRGVILARKTGAEFLPIPAFGVTLILLPLLLMYYGLDFTSPVISMAYLAFALLSITLGFLKKFTLLRHLGLGLTLLSLAKLFILDFSGLSSQLRILSYFVFGILLIAISFAYQYFNKRVETSAKLLTVEDEQ